MLFSEPDDVEDEEQYNNNNDTATNSSYSTEVSSLANIFIVNVINVLEKKHIKTIIL